MSKRHKAMVAVVAAAALGLAGCSAANGGDGGEASAEPVQLLHAQNPSNECIIMGYLWEDLLADRGYEIEHQLMEPAAGYAGFAGNQIDMNFCGVEATHHMYWDEYGEHFTPATVWTDANQHGMIVPEYVDADSIEDLAGRADEFNGRIVGIEPGSGLMAKVDGVFEAYDLEGFEMMSGSSPSMAAELERAVNAEEDIVVAGWMPHSMWHHLDIKMLEDPEGAWGPNNDVSLIVGSEVAENEELMDMFSRFSIETENLNGLLAAYEEAGGEDAVDEVLAEWMAVDENRELTEYWLDG